MRASPNVQAYPWDALEPISRETAAQVAAIQSALADQVSIDALERGLREIVGGDVQIAFGRYVEPSNIETSPGALHFESSDGGFAASLTAEPQLVDVLLSKLLGQKAGLARGDAASNPALRGALSRIVVETWRASGVQVALIAGSGQRERNALASLGVGGTLVYDGKPYAVFASVRALRLREPTAPGAALRALGSLPLTVPLCGVSCVTPRAELDGLGLGDAFLPGSDWWWTPGRGGRLAILTSEHQTGAFFEPLDDRSAKLCPSDAKLPKGSTLMAHDDEKTLPGSALDSVLDAPLVVHVEVATVTLPGRAWSELKPGDVVRTDQRLGEQATLRIAGRAAAKGELVNVEGELGIRIRRLIEGENDET